MRTRQPLVVACMALALGVVSCIGGESGGQEGIWRVSPTPTVEIGVVEGADPYMFESVQFAGLLADGRVVVADAGQLVIRVFSPDGQIQTEIGGSGGGPGQFRSINGMWLTSEGKIAGWDASNLRITTFSPDGAVERTDRVVVGSEFAPGNLEVFFGAFGNGDIALASLEFGGDPGEGQEHPDRWMLARYRPDGVPRSSLGQLRGMRRVRGQPQPFTPLPYVALYGDSMFVSDGYEAEITVQDPSGVPTRTIELPPTVVSSTDAWSALEAELQRRETSMFLQLLEHVPRGDQFPQVGGLLIDDEGLIWVKTYDPAADALWLKGVARPSPGGEWRIVRRDGEPVATVQMPKGVAPLDIRGNRLLGVSQDALDVERVVVHTVER